MAGDKESTLVFKVDGTQAETGVAKVKRSLHDLADTANREGQRGASGIAGMGAGAEKSAAQIERATQRQISEIRRMTAELESGGKATRAYQEAMASIRGVDASALRPYLDQLEQARTRMAGLGATSAQTANQMRMVAPQITDIVTQLASGQSAFTIFIQQGGQLKDMFGGVGNAAKAIGTYVMGLINPFTLAAGAAALLATAYYQGSKESEAYSKAIVLSGNAAGVTAGQLSEMARSMETATRTQSAAGAALAEMAQNSRVGSDELQRYTTIALDFEKVTGTAVSKTAEAFASLAKEPLQAALKLNDGVNWLTTSTYEHIKSLEEQGRKTDAARVAQEAYANSIAQKTAQLQGNLGALERGWNSLAGAAKSAWSAMLNIGRQETLGDQLNSARSALDARMQRGPINEGVRGAWETGNERLKQQIALLSEQERMLKRGAEAQAAANAQVQARISLDAKYGDKLKTDQQKAKAARDEIAELGKAAGKSADEIKKLQDASDATFNRGGGGGRKGGGAGRTSAAPGENEIARIKTMIEEEQRYIAALQERGKEAEKLTAGEKLVLKLQQDLQTSMSGVAKANKEKALAAAQELVSVEKVRVAEEKRIKADEESRKRLIASIDEERAARMKLAEEAAKRVDSIGKENDRMREEIETMGLSAAQIAARTIEVNNATIAEKENQLARLKNDNITTREMAALEEEIKLLKERNELIGSKAAKQGAIDAAKQVEDEWKKTADSINQSLTDALLRGFEGGKDFAKNFKDTLVNMFKTLVLRPVISFIVQPIGNAISGLISGFLGGGQGGAGGIGSMVSNGSSLLNLFGGGVGGNMGAISGFFGGGMSFGNAAGSIAANGMAGAGMYGGNSLNAFLATNGAYGTAGSGAAGLGGMAAGLAVVAAPLIIGALAESRTRDRFSGAAFATSNFGKDPTVTIGGAEYDPIKGILPDREALVGRALEAGISQDMIDRFKDKDRALLHYIRMLDSSRQSGNEGPPINVNALLENDNMYAADWYRGQGYAHPQAMGWWNDKGYDLASNDPAITTASRAVATSIVGPLTEINRILGGAADDFRVTAGYATRGDGKGVWAGLNVSQGENNLVDWVNMDDFHSPQEAVKGMYEQAMGALEKLDLPKWAQEQVDGAQAAMAGLKGDKMGEEAAALYAQTAGSIAQTISAIKMLIDVFPDFSNATQDSVYALAELMGGMDNLQSAYSTYIGAFWSEGERQALTIAQLTAQLAELGQTMPTTAEGFRRMVEDALAAGEEGNALAAALLGMSGAMAQVLVQTEAVTFGAAQDLAGAIQAGLLGTFDGDNLGAFMAQTVSDGIYNAIAGGFAAQITDIIVQGVVNPVIQAALTGSSVSAAVSAASIESMVAQAQAVAQAAAAVLNDPAIRDAIGSIASAVASINVPAMSAAPRYVSSYTDAVRDSGRAAEEAAREAERLADAWRSIGDTLIDEVNRIRGVVADAGGDSLSYYQSLFAMDTAAARAGDQEAAGRLTGLSGDLLRAAEAQAGSLFELQQMRAWVAQSLQDTAGYAYAKAGGTVPATPAPVTTPPPAMFALKTAQQDNGTRELNQQIAVLTEQNQRQSAQLADLQLQLLRVFRRWDDEGMPPQREDEGVTP